MNMQVIQGEERKLPRQIHQLILEERKLLTLTGVLDVDNFDDQKIEARTELGIIIVEGEQLHINRLSVDSGEMVVEGNIGGIAYIDKMPEKGGFFSRLLK